MALDSLGNRQPFGGVKFVGLVAMRRFEADLMEEEQQVVIVAVLEVVGQYFSEAVEVEQPAAGAEVDRTAFVAEAGRMMLVVVRMGTAVVAAACMDSALLASVVVARRVMRMAWSQARGRSGSRVQRLR